MVDKIWYNMEELIGGSEERGINRNILECKVRYEIGILQNMERINRNILECKVFVLFYISRFFFGINRNILECKESTKARGATTKRVLIETYWNVKKYTQTADLGYIPY